MPALLGFGYLVAGIIVAISLLSSAIKIVREYQRLVVFRLGRSVGKKGPGVVFLWPVVDRAVLSAVNLGMNVRMENGLLDRDSRELISARVLERLVSPERHLGKEYQVRSIIQIQARRLASFLRGGAAYRPFRFKW